MEFELDCARNSRKMLGAVDATKRPLRIPLKFVPYMEKHRIYELFHEIAIQLVIKKPSDHILYMKQCLHHAAKLRDSPRIILFAPPDFDKDLLAEYLGKKLSIHPVTLEIASPTNITTEDLARNTRHVLRERYFRGETGWIFTDFPRNKLEARALQRFGILPTHVIEIAWTVVPSDCSSTTHNIAKSRESVRNLHGSANKSKICSDYESRIRGLREAYTNLLITVETAGRSFEELGNACIAVTKKQRICTPCIFRVLLIGSRGSGRRCVADYLAHRYNLVNIDFDYLLRQTRLQKTPLGKSLQCFERRWGIMPQADMRIKVVENKLMNRDCIKRGWVLTGYPITVKDFELLDLLTTPPNRVIFLNVDRTVCRKRLLSRRFNMITGSEHHLPLDDNYQAYEMPGLTMHPKDYRSRVEQDLQEYEKNVEAMLRYAGQSAEVIDAMAEKRVVCKRVEARLIQPMSTSAPRNRKSMKEMDPMDIEFEPDDELDYRIFDSMRAEESILSLV